MCKRVIAIVSAFMLALAMTFSVQASDLDTHLGTWGELIKGTKGIDVLMDDFEDLPDGESLVGQANIEDHWVLERGSGEPTHNMTVFMDGGQKAVNFGPFTQMVSKYKLNNRYIFEIEGKGTGQCFGMFVRTTGEHFTVGNGEVIAFYSHDLSDWSSNAHMGSSGIFLVPGGWGSDIITIYVKVYRDNLETKLANERIDIKLEGVDFGSAYHKITMTDDGSVLNFFVDEQKFASVEMSGEATYPDLSANKFFKSVVVKDSAGNVLRNVDNVLLSKDFSVPLIALRISNYAVNSVSLREYAAYTEPNTETGDNVSLYSVFALLTAGALLSLVFKRKIYNV